MRKARGPVAKDGRVSNIAISSEEFAARKQAAIDNEPFARAYPLSKIQIEPDSIKYGYVKLDGQQALVSDGFFKDLARSMNINATMVNDFTGKKGKKDNGLDEHGASFLGKLMDAVGSFKATKGGPSITVIADSKSKTIISATPSKNFARIPNERLFSLAERLIDRHPELTPHDVINSNGGLKTGIILASNNMAKFDGNFQDDESFKFGISLGNSPTGTQLGDFSMRLVCSNGMTGLANDFKFNLKGLDGQRLEDFYRHIDVYAANSFIPTDFAARLNAANETEASFYEIEQAFNKVNGLIGGDNGSDYKKHLSGKLVQEYFPGYGETYMKLAKKGLIINHLSDKQKQFIRSGQCIWDVINSVTFLGSHDTELGIANRTSLTGLAGKMFQKEFDLQYANLLF